MADLDYTLTETNTIIRDTLIQSNLPISVQYYLLKDILNDVEQSYSYTMREIRNTMLKSKQQQTEPTATSLAQD